MSEETRKLVSFPGQPSDSEETPQREAGKGSDSPESFTRKEANDFLDNKFQEFAKEIQSRTDKSLSHVTENVREEVQGVKNSIEFLKEQGVEITPEQEKQLEDAAFKESILGGEEDPEQPSSPKEPDGEGQPTPEPSEEGTPTSSEQSGPLEAEAKRIMQEELGEGNFVFSDDPEAETIKDSQTIEEYLLNVRKAAKQKAVRENRLPSSPGSSGGKSKGSVMDKSDGEIWDEVKKSL